MPWTPQEIKARLETGSRKWVEGAIVAIHNRQTNAEQQVGDTMVHNKIGFSGAHARTGSYYAEWIKSKKPLTGKHLEKARGIAMRYSRQLAEIANEKEANVS